jgi:predicted acetyltransferase
LIGEKNNPQGYIIYQQTIVNGKVYLEVKDWVALNNSAMERLWTLIADHRSQVNKCQFTGAFYDQKMLLLPEQTGQILSHDLWFTRIIDVFKALEMRPYPLNLEIELDLAIQDSLITNNSSNFQLQISKGKGKLITGGKGEFKLKIRDLAPLYTGLYTAKQLHFCGKIEAKDSILNLANQIFILPTPSLPDFF